MIKNIKNTRASVPYTGLLLSVALIATACASSPGTVTASDIAPADVLTQDADQPTTNDVFGFVSDQKDPLGDALPGMGRSASNVERDETIALYQAYLREVAISECMLRNGFQYAPDGLYPRELVMGIAPSLSSKAVIETPSDFDATVTPVTFTNDGHVASIQVGWNDAGPWNELLLSNYIESRTGDEYMLSLYGETLQSMEDADQHSADKDGDHAAESGSEIATGGCSGEAWKQIPGIWTIKAEVGDKFKDIELRYKNKAFAQCRSDLGLTEDSLGELEAAMSDLQRSDSDRFFLANAFEQCASLWDDAGIEARSSDEYIKLFDQMSERYASHIETQYYFLEEALSDSWFGSFVASVDMKPRLEPLIVPEPAAPGEADVIVVPDDAPPVERSPDVAAAAPPPEELLHTFVTLLDVKWGPGEHDAYPTWEFLWDEQSHFVSASSIETALPKEANSVLFACSDHHLRITGPWNYDRLDDDGLPERVAVSDHLIEAVLASFNGDCVLDQ